MQKSTLILFILLLIGCDSTYEPGASVSQGGDGVYAGAISKLELQKEVLDICEKRNCSKFEVRGHPDSTTLHIDMYITDNDLINIQKFANNRSIVDFSQKDMVKPSIKTILVLRDLKEQGFDWKYTGGEKWHCNGKPLKKRYCQQEVIKGHGEDFLDYIVQDNHMKFEYKDGDKIIQL